MIKDQEIKYGDQYLSPVGFHGGTHKVRTVWTLLSGDDRHVMVESRNAWGQYSQRIIDRKDFQKDWFMLGGANEN